MFKISKKMSMRKKEMISLKMENSDQITSLLMRKGSLAQMKNSNKIQKN
jgi:hypothetical protein